jgi:serine/threonine protein kinase/tetratricopeptide (TPR) repeat protein
MRERTIFMAALDIDDPAERWAFLDESCRGSPDLRKRVEALIHSHEQDESFLNSPPPGIEATAFCSVGVGSGDTIGSYKVLEQIGEGGFGVVYLAEQERPVRRKVALKIIKPGMDTKQVIARFEAERQVLAMMDHPNIAKVLDAGTTGGEPPSSIQQPASSIQNSGRPYFVMELVQGVPITEYCDQCNLTNNERLELFITVCQAVQHAHQKGIIHRDLKPTNVLVAIQDGQPAPKIIDFGVAKAIDEQLTEHTLTTAFAQMIGSPLYMSPEQAELSPLGVDTRSDIYSLGVLLYELLTGTTPFDKDRLHAASYDELRRIIREEEPPGPSARVSTLAADLATTFAERRRTDPRRLIQTIRGELDWIVMKCLEKDRNRRYETASGLVSDIESYLNDEPVEACPPSTMYRFRKFARRNKFVIRAAGLVALALIVGSIVSTWQAVRATRAEGQALQAQGQSHQAINDYFTLVSEDEALRYEPALQPLRRKLLDTALAYYEQFSRKNHTSPQMRAEMAATCSRVAILTYELGTGDDWFDWLDKGNAIIEELLNEQHDLSKFPSLTSGQRWLVGNITMWVGDLEKSKQILERWRYVAEELALRFPNVRGFQNDLAAYYMAMGKVYKRSDIAKAQESVAKARHIWEKLTRDHRDVPEYRAALASSICYTATMLIYAQQPGADLEMQHAVRLQRELVEGYPNVPSYRDGLAIMHEEFGFVLEHLGDYKQAEDEYRGMIESYEELQRDYPNSIQFQLGVLRGRMWLGELLWHKGDPAHATQQFQEALQLGEKLYDRDLFASYYFAYLLANCADPSIRDAQRAKRLAENVVEQVTGLGDGWITLGWALYRAGDHEGAVKALETGIGLFTNYDTCTAHFLLAMANWHLGKKKEALRRYEFGLAQLDKEYDMLEYHRVRDEAARELGLPNPENNSASPEPALPSVQKPAPTVTNTNNH